MVYAGGQDDLQLHMHCEHFCFQERCGGVASHVSPFVEVQDLGNLLSRCGFGMLTIDSDEERVAFPSVFELMRDLKGMAENNAAWNRPLHIKRDV